MINSKRSQSPLDEGCTLEFDGLKLTLGQAQDLESGGWAHEARSPQEVAHVLLELPPGELPESLRAAFEIPGVAAPCARRSNDDRTLLALRASPGPTLQWILRRRENLSLWDLGLVDSLAALFQRVHDAGLCFRRVGPHLFSVGPDGQIGLERPDLLRRPGEPPDRGADVFTAPEIVGGTAGDARSDQFSLGTLAYALITGRLPYVRGQFPLPRIYRPSLPHGTHTALERATRIRPSERHECCGAFARELRARTLPRGRSPMGVAVAASTEIGRLKRQSMPVNQDAWYFGLDSSSHRGILLVADGVSTADVGSGDLASSMVRDAVRAAWEGPVGEILRTHEGPLPEDWARAALEAILEDANGRIYSFLKQPIFVGSLGPSIHPPGSTAVLAILDGDRLTVANLGDSRLYLLRDGALEQMTVDQDLRTELLQSGRDPRTVGEQGSLGALTHSVGHFFFDHEGGITARKLAPDVRPLYLRAGDRLLICSDGVPDCLGDGAEELIARELSAGDDPAAISARLCRLADEELGADNITALVLLAL